MEIKNRNEIPEKDTWNLSDIFASDEAWQKEYEALKAYPEKISASEGKLGESAENLLAFFELDDELNVRLQKLQGYACCKSDEDVGNSFYQDLRGKAMSTIVELSSAAAFSMPEIMAIPEETLVNI